MNPTNAKTKTAHGCVGQIYGMPRSITRAFRAPTYEVPTCRMPTCRAQIFVARTFVVRTWLGHAWCRPT